VPVRVRRGVILRILVIGLVAALLPSSPSGAAQVRAGALSVTTTSTDHRATPLGIDNPAPRLSWQLAGSRRGEAQTAAQVQVATSPDALADGDLVWDSGRLDTAEQHVDWGGTALRSSQRYHWRVRAWDSADAPSGWSTTWFETALLDETEWDGSSWIGARDPADWTGASWIGTRRQLCRPAPQRARATFAGRSPSPRARSRLRRSSVLPTTTSGSS